MIPTRVLFVYYGTRGLAGAYIDGFARALESCADVEPEFAVSAAYAFAPRRGRVWRGFFPLTDGPASPRWLSSGPLRLPLRYAELCGAYLWLTVVCLRHRIDTVNFSLIDDYFVSWAFLRIVKALGCTVHVTAHDSKSYSTAADRWRRWVFALASRILVHYDHVKRDLVAHFGLTAEQVLVLPFPGAGYSSAVDPARVERARADVLGIVGPSKRVVLFLGVVRPQKGIEVLLSAWRSLEERLNASRAPGVDRDVVLVVAGRGPSLVEEMSGLSAVRVPAYLSDEHYVAWLERASVVAFPFSAPHYAHSATVLLAALAERPLVLSDIPLFRGLADVLHAWLSRAGDPEALAEVLERALADGEERTRRGRAAKRGVTGLIEDLPQTLGPAYARELRDARGHSR